MHLIYKKFIYPTTLNQYNYLNHIQMGGKKNENFMIEKHFMEIFTNSFPWKFNFDNQIC